MGWEGWEGPAVVGRGWKRPKRRRVRGSVTDLRRRAPPVEPPVFLVSPLLGSSLWSSVGVASAACAAACAAAAQRLAPHHQEEVQSICWRALPRAKVSPFTSYEHTCKVLCTYPCLPPVSPPSTNTARPDPPQANSGQSQRAPHPRVGRTCPCSRLHQRQIKTRLRPSGRQPQTTRPPKKTS